MEGELAPRRLRRADLGLGLLLEPFGDDLDVDLLAHVVWSSRDLHADLLRRCGGRKRQRKPAERDEPRESTRSRVHGRGHQSLSTGS